MVSLAAGILNTWRRFAVPAATPVLLNLCVIAATLWGAPWFAALGIEPIYALACGTVLGGVLQLAVQVPALRAVGYLPRLGFVPGAVAAAWRHPGVRRVLAQMAPAVLGVSVAQISLLINTHIASRLAVGSVSWLNLADRLMELPTALLGVAMGVVLLPQLSAAQARDDQAGYSAMLDWGLRLVVLLTLPCAVALVVFPAADAGGAVPPRPLHRPRRGAERAGRWRPTASGLLGIVAVKVLAPGYYARQDMRTPVRIAIAVLVLTQLMNLVLVPWLAHAALTLSIGLGALVNAGWLLRGLMRAGVYRPAPRLGRASALSVLLGCAVLGAGLFWAARRHRLDRLPRRGPGGVPACWPACWARWRCCTSACWPHAACVCANSCAGLEAACAGRCGSAAASLYTGGAGSQGPSPIDVAQVAVQCADPVAVLRRPGGRRLGPRVARGGGVDRAGRVPRARRADGAVADRRAGRQAQGARAGRRRAGAAAALPEPLLLPRARLRRQRQRLLRPPQQLHATTCWRSGAASRSRWRCCTSSWPARSASRRAACRFPAHFLIKLRMPQGEVVIDPFNGHSLSREELDERLAPYRRRQGLVGDFEVPLGLFLQAAPPRDVIARMLRNLKEIHRSGRGLAARWLAVQRAAGGAAAAGLGRAARPWRWR